MWVAAVSGDRDHPHDFGDGGNGFGVGRTPSAVAWEPFYLSHRQLEVPVPLLSIYITYGQMAKNI